MYAVPFTLLVSYCQKGVRMSDCAWGGLQRHTPRPPSFANRRGVVRFAKSMKGARGGSSFSPVQTSAVARNRRNLFFHLFRASSSPPIRYFRIAHSSRTVGEFENSLENAEISQVFQKSMKVFLNTRKIGNGRRKYYNTGYCVNNFNFISIVNCT